MIRTFEKYNSEKKYAIITYSYSELCVEIKSKATRVSFGFLTSITIDDVKFYTLNAANSILPIMKEIFQNNVFEVIPIEELELKINANKYNL
jgi:hypothetical protein